MTRRSSECLVDPERLRRLAKQASEIHLGMGEPLTQAVVSVVKEEPQLNTDHVRRVVEFANNETFQQMFKEASGDHRVVTFSGGPADPVAVLKELEMIGAVQVGGGGYRSFESGTGLVSKAQGQTKLASALPEEVRDYQRLTAMRGHLGESFRQATNQYEDALQWMCKEARCALLDGEGTPDIVRALSRYALRPELAKLALSHIERDFVQRGLEVENQSMRKQGWAINPKSSLIGAFKEFQQAAFTRFKFAAAIERVDDMIGQVKQQQRRGSNG